MQTTGVSVTQLLTIAFVVLKLVGVITWSWWWVLSPLWISAVLIGFLYLAWFCLYYFFGRK